MLYRHNRKTRGTGSPVCSPPPAATRLGRVLVVLTALLAVIVLSALGPAASPPVRAETLEQKLIRLQKQMDWVQRQLELKDAQLKEAVRREKGLMRDLDVIEDRLATAEAALEEVDAELALTEDYIELATRDLADANRRLEERRGLLARRLRALYEYGRVSYLEVLLQSTSFSDLVSRSELLYAVIQADSRLFDQVKGLQARCESRKADLEDYERQLTLLRQEREDAKRKIEAQVASRRQLLQQIQQDKESYARALDEFERTSKQLEKTIVDIQKQLRRSRRNLNCIWPTDSHRVTSEYGMRYHPILHQNRMHSGIDIGAPWGASVRATESGTVIYAGTLGGYGRMIIIDHGGGVASLYAHLSSINVKVGRDVGRGQVIGRIGTTGMSTGPHLHFEIRVDGKTENPRNWL